MSNNNSKRRDNREVEPNERLIIHNLSFDTTEETLNDYFSQYGKIVEVDILRDGKSGRSRGFGFVSFETVEAATKANKDEEVELDGRQVRTNFAKKRNNNNKGRGNRSQPGKKLYIGNLPWKLNEEELKSFYESYGEVEDAFLSTVKYAPEIDGYPQHKGFGFVTFVNEEDANKAVAAKDQVLKGNKLSVRKAKPQKGKNRRNNNNRSKPSKEDKKKPVVVKRKQGSKKANDKKPSNNNKSQPKKNAPKANNNNKSAKKPANNNNKPAKKQKNKGPKIVSSKKNPWKAVQKKEDSTAKDFPSLNKKQGNGKGKEEVDN